MKYTFIFLMICSLWSYSQELSEENLSIIDTTGTRLTYSENLYFHNLTIKESENKKIVTLEWIQTRNVRALIIELRDLKTKKLFNREIHHSTSAQLPAAAEFTLYPISHTQKGEAITTTLARFKANKSQPINTRSYQKVVEKKEQQRKENAERKKQIEDGVFTFIDTTSYIFSNKLYFYDLTIKESTNKDKVILSWQKQRNIKHLMIELRDLETKELFYRDKHYVNNVELPAFAEYTVYPVYYKQKGEAITTTLIDFKANGSNALNPQSYYNALEKSTREKQVKKDREAAKQAYKEEQKRYAQERANRITPKVVILISIVVFLAIIIVFGIWLIRYLTKPKDPKEYSHRENNSGWD